MQRENDDDATWRSIVENYGERARIDDDPPADPESAYDGPAGPARPAGPAGPAGPGSLADHPDADPFDDTDVEPEDRFVPPTPPPLPRVSPDRLVAWIGIFGSPALLLVALIFSVHLPTVVGYLLVAGFVGGFLYLVAKMPRGPRDPWDDGAQI